MKGQYPAGQKQGGQRPDSALYRATMKDSAFMRNMAPIGKVIGVLSDSSNRQPMEFASVALLKVKDSSAVGGALTDDKGQFKMEDVMPGRYFIRITSIGYRQLDSKPFMLNPQEPLKDFGNVWMPPSSRVLKETEIVGEKVEYVNSLDKKVYNVDKSMINAGGSASEVLQNIPSVNVDIDGKISLRGSEQVTILIDGKPAGLTGDNRGSILQQLPAGTIDQIEVITNPSAKYDAEGTSGIINIKTKKDKNQGINGIATLGVGTKDKYNASLNLNRRTKTNNLYFNYSFRDDRRTNEGSSFRTNTFGVDTTYVVSWNNGYNDNISHSLRAGLDLYLDDYNTLGFSGSFNLRNEKRRDYSFSATQDAELLTLSSFSRLAKSTEESSIMDGSFDYRHTYANSKRELTASGNLNVNESDDQNVLNTFFPPPTSQLRQRVNTKGLSYSGVAQVDYLHPFENSKVETGLKATLRNNDSKQSSDRYDFDNDSYNVDSLFSDQFIFTEWVYAGYFQWSGRYKLFELSAGLRAEQTLIEGESKSADTSFTRDFINLFPSAAIKYRFSEGKDIQLSYSRRVNRPRERQLNPFRSVSDSLNVFVGNPSILPELTHSLELGFSGIYGNTNVSANLYYRNTSDNTQRFRTVDPITNVATQTFVNYKTAENMGAELILRNSILKIFTTSATFTLFYNKVDATNVQSNLVSEVWSGDIRGSISTKLSKQLSFQITGNYMAPRKQPQGTFKGMSGVDFGFKYDFKGGKWSVNGSLSDVFDNREFNIDNMGLGFRQEMVRKRETRVGNLTLSYRFGKTEVGRDRKRQGNRPQDQGQQNDMMDF
ncbi:MAG: TonB-dependent receptor [Bacteroidetes bacterium]|nr:TonB-dependent receptor [Bacteroidota bacterium]